jgi:MoaA/NifB/PqqE/SkfB family radical SAM enzyme
MLRELDANTAIHSEEFYFQWHITDRCNLRCAHCYQNGYSLSSELTLEELKAVGRKINYTTTKKAEKTCLNICHLESTSKKLR